MLTPELQFFVAQERKRILYLIRENKEKKEERSVECVRKYAHAYGDDVINM